MHRTSITLYLILALFILEACNNYQKDSIAAKAAVKNWPTRRELFDEFRKQRKLVIVYPDQYPAYREVPDLLKEAQDDRTDLVARPASEVDLKVMPTEILLLVGTPSSNPLMEKMMDKLPLAVKEKELVFDKKSYTDTSSIFSISFYPNPLNPKLPLLLITGLNEEKIAHSLEDALTGRRSFRWSNWGYQLLQNNKRVLLGQFNEATWAVDKNVHFDYTGSPVAVHQTDIFQFIPHQLNVSEKQLEELSEIAGQNVANISTFCEYTGDLPMMELHLYASAEDKGMMTNNTDQTHVDFRENIAHTVVNETYRGNYIGKENELILRHVLGQPKTKTLETGLAIYFTDAWQWKGYQYWAGRLFHSGNLLPLSEVIGEDLTQGGFRLLQSCLSASFVHFLIEHWGRKEFLEKYTDWEPRPEELAELENGWQKFLARMPHDIPQDRQQLKSSYWKGFNFAHQGYSIYNGYISKQATESLEKLHTIGTNAVAIVPYSYMRDPDQPSFIPVSDSPGSENDESVIHSASMAKKLGMTVMMKPQIWFGRGSWPGDMEMQSEADWNQFFDNYYRWILHYALLSEIHQLDIFCIGTEFAKATVQREADWRELIKRINGIYSGQITYAANWGEEFENIGFWDALDIIGLDCYYPLSENPNAKRAELEQGFDSVLDKIEETLLQHNRPFIFTEIGFPSITAPWINPHKDDRSATFNGQHQKMCYEIVFEGIQSKDWCNGIFWWKFPANLDYRWEKEKGFTPCDKPALAVVKEWFGKLGG